MELPKHLDTTDAHKTAVGNAVLLAVPPDLDINRRPHVVFIQNAAWHQILNLYLETGELGSPNYKLTHIKGINMPGEGFQSWTPDLFEASTNNRLLIEGYHARPGEPGWVRSKLKVWTRATGSPVETNPGWPQLPPGSDPRHRKYAVDIGVDDSAGADQENYRDVTVLFTYEPVAAATWEIRNY